MRRAARLSQVWDLGVFFFLFRTTIHVSVSHDYRGYVGVWFARVSLVLENLHDFALQVVKYASLSNEMCCMLWVHYCFE